MQDGEEPRDVHFTWENVEDKGWGSVEVMDDTRIVEIEEPVDQFCAEEDVIVESGLVTEPIDRLESVVLEECTDKESEQEVCSEEEPMDEANEGTYPEGVPLDEPVEKKDTVHEEAGTMKDVLIQ